MVDYRNKQTIGTAELSPEMQAALLGGDGRAHQGFSVPLSVGKRANSLIDCVGLDELATMVTIAFDATRPGSVDAGTENDLPPVFARLSWGVDGHRMQLEVDVVVGTALAVPASSLRVDVFIDLPADVGDFNDVQVGAVMGYMPHGKHAAQRTLQAALAHENEPADPASTAVLAVPAFARNVTFLVSPAGTFLLEQLDDSAGSTVLSTIAAVAPAVPPTVVFPLANRTRYLRITNTGPDDLLVSAVFGLAV